jgi:hypothetical protein
MEDSQIAMIVSIFKWSNDLDELGIFGGTTMAYEMLTHGVLLRKKGRTCQCMILQAKSYDN